MKLKYNSVGCLSELDLGNGDVISQPWGAELGDWHHYCEKVVKQEVREH